MDTSHIISLCVLAVVLTLTTYTELKSDRIPDWIIAPAMIVGLLLGYFEGGITLGSSLGGLLIGFGFLFLFYMFGGMGGGDVKLMGAVGALLGHRQILPVLVYTAFVGGAMAVLILVWHRQLWRGLARSLGMFFRWKQGPGLDDTDEEGKKPLTVPYGLAIVAGCLMHVYFQSQRLTR